MTHSLRTHLRHGTIATFFIAACAMSTGAWGQKVYRCGDSYSQTPCTGAEVKTGVLDASDPRSAAQKTQADQATARDVATVQALEKAQRKEEAQAKHTEAQHKTADKSKTKGKESAGKAKSKSKKGSEYFTAASAPEKKKSKKGSGD